MAKNAEKWRNDLHMMLQFASQGVDCADGLMEELGTIQDICEAMLRDLDNEEV